MDGPALPGQMVYHCIAEINETATFIAGGVYNNAMSKKAFIYNWSFKDFFNAEDMDDERFQVFFKLTFSKLTIPGYVNRLFKIKMKIINRVDKKIKERKEKREQFFVGDIIRVSLSRTNHSPHFSLYFYTTVLLYSPFLFRKAQELLSYNLMYE